MAGISTQLEARLKQGCNELNLEFSDLTYKQLLTYLDLLIRWNKAYNLSSVREPLAMVTRHLLDSLSILPHVDQFECRQILDVGTGAGLPGMVLALANDRGQFTLLDSNGKKTRFLTQVCLELKLANVKVVNTRVENFQSRGGFDVILTRAFASLADTVTLVAPLAGQETRIMAMKAQLLNDELRSLPEHFVVESIKSLRVPGLDENRNLVIMIKNKQAGLI